MKKKVAFSSRHNKYTGRNFGQDSQGMRPIKMGVRGIVQSMESTGLDRVIFIRAHFPGEGEGQGHGVGSMDM